MKTVIRRGIFETNSSSTHTLALVSRSDYDNDMAQAKPKYRKYGMVSTKYDKLLMACGCCAELFPKESQIARYAGEGDEFQIERKKRFDDVKYAIADGYGDMVYLYTHANVYYEVAISMFVRVYCELTGADYGKTYADVDKKNKSGRACHMKFFDEGALYDPTSDYRTIEELFDGNENEVLSTIRKYFNDDTVLVYREYYSGICGDDDDD